MTDTREQSVRGYGGRALVALAVLALGSVSRADTPDPNIPTPIEQAVIDYRCSRSPAAGASGTDAYQACLDTELLSIRSDFGRDLSRISAATRRTIDSACREPRELRGREAYVECLSRQLATRVLGREGSSTSVAANPALTSPSPITPAASPEVAVPTAVPRSWLFYAGWLGALLLGFGGAAAGVVLSRKRKPTAAAVSPHKCAACAMEISGAGDLCQRCRHEAADAVRRAAAAERALEQQKKALPRPLPRT